MIVFALFGTIIVATFVVLLWPDVRWRKKRSEPNRVECRWCGILDPVCRLMWVGSRRCCPDCDHRPPENVDSSRSLRNQLAEAFIRGLEIGAESPEIAGEGDEMYEAFRRWVDPTPENVDGPT